VILPSIRVVENINFPSFPSHLLEPHDDVSYDIDDLKNSPIFIENVSTSEKNCDN